MTAVEKPWRKGVLADWCCVTPARVSQWISEGKISGDAIVGTGRTSRIRPRLAIEQLRQRLDARQTIGNGIATNLELPPLVLVEEANAALAEPSRRPTASSVPPALDEVGDAIRREQLESLQRRNRREAIDEAERSGLLVSAEGASQAMGRMATRIVVSFEGSLSDLAAAVAARFEVPQRDVLHVMRNASRDSRNRLAEALKLEMQTIPKFETVEIETEN